MKTRAYGFILLLTACTALAEPAEKIGYIRNLQGSAAILRDGASRPAAVGLALHRGDLIRSGKPGAVGIVLSDDTSIALGSGSELSLNEYAFSPKEGRFALVMRLTKGTFSYLSGLIEKLAPHTTQLQTPDATIAVRGTKLLIEVKG